MTNIFNNNFATILLAKITPARTRRQKNGNIIEYTFLGKDIKRVAH
jgi:hypothetical protein